VDFSAIQHSNTGKWEIHVDSGGVQEANDLTMERLSGAGALVRLVQSTPLPGQ
jgi:hypothetical protein